MAWRGSLSRSLMSTARSSTFRSSPSLPRPRPPPLSAPRLQPRRPSSFTNPREDWKRWVMRGDPKHQKAVQCATMYLKTAI